MAGRQPFNPSRRLPAWELWLVLGAVMAPLPSAAIAPTPRADLLLATIRPGLRAAAFAPTDTSRIMFSADAMPMPADTVDADRGETTARTGQSTERPKVIVYRADSPRNFEISLRLKPTSPSAQAGVAMRRRTPNDYYVLQVDPHDEKIVFARVSHGQSKEIASAESDIGTNAWHTLYVRAQDNRFTVLLDGQWLFTAYDASLPQPGHVALWTSSDGRVEFDGISVKPIGPE